MHQMTEQQREFWRQLTAPFQRDAYETRTGKGGRSFTYLNSRVIENRLDDVCGPDGWQTSVREGARGMIVKLTIRIPNPDGNSDSLLAKHVSRCGVAGRREMPDENDIYKASHTDAFKRAASTFGIGRDLYRDGMPSYCADLHNCQATGTPQGASGGSVGPPPSRPPVDRPSAPQRQDGPGKPPYDKPGKNAFAWAKNVSEYYHTDIAAKMSEYAKKSGESWKFDEWTTDFINDCLDKAIRFIKTLDNYNDEYGPKPEGLPVQNRLPMDSSVPAPAATNDSMALKKSIIAATTALLVKRNAGRPPSNGETLAEIGEVGASVANGQGQTGAVMTSLKDCQDRPWMFRIKTRLEYLISEEAQMAQIDQADNLPEYEDIPI